MTRTGCALALAALCWLPAAPAAAQVQAAERAACQNAQSTAAMRECENARLGRAEAAMKAAYDVLAAKLDERGREKLRAAHGAWRRFREAEAAFQADAVRDGTLAPLVATGVRADLTEARLKELEKAAAATK